MMMGLIVDADAVTRRIPNILKLDGGKDLTWLGELYRVMKRDASPRDVDLMHANLEFAFGTSISHHEPQGMFVEVPDAADFPEEVGQTSLILEWEFVPAHELELRASEESEEPEPHIEFVPGGLRVLRVRQARLAYVESLEGLGADPRLVHLDTERKSVWSLQ